jgi:ABC-type transport system involved in multi-copper enzyme maturation permease subunit
MPTGLILSRELRSGARRWKTYRRRYLLAIGMLLALGNLYFLTYLPKPKPVSIRDMAWFAEYAFGQAALVQILLTIWLVPACVAGLIAEEKERRSLTHLLTTRLTSAEIVLGKLAAGLVQYTSCLATGFPIMIVLPLFGGVDGGWILLTYAGTCSTAYVLAGLSILLSTAARRPERAVATAIGLAASWCSLPLLIQSLNARTFPRFWPWIHAANEWVLASTPTSVLLAAIGAGPRWRVYDSIVWMIGLQFAIGSVLIVWAVARFRGACRAQVGRDGGARGGKRLQHWLGRRPPCGEDPVLWKEIHTARPRGIAEILCLLIALGLAAFIGHATYTFAKPAFQEWFAHGFGNATSGVRRAAFNRFLRPTTSWLEFFTLLIVAGVAAGGVTSERARETWDSLIATPLDGLTILRAKWIGAIWKVRWGILLLVVLWSVGLLARAIHPLGFVAAVVLLAVAIWFVAALGTYASLVSRDTPQASNRALVPVVLLANSCAFCYLPPRIATVLMGAGSAPFVNFLSLASYGDIREVMTGQETFSGLEELGLYTYEGPMRVLATCLFGTSGLAIAAAWLSRAAVMGFDRAVGRPERARKPREQLITEITGDSPHRRRSWWRKGMILGFVSVLLTLGIAYVIPSWRDQRSLHDALAETDRLCPGWRLEDLEAARAQVPEATNAALRVLGAGDALSARWHRTGEQPSDAERKRLDAIANLAPAQCLIPRTFQSLQADVNEVALALAEARDLMNLSEGRFPVAWASDGISTRLPHMATTRDVVNLLAYDVLLRSQKKDTDGALASCRALLNAGRSIGDEPTAVSQCLRIEIRVTACQQVELALAHGQASESVLAMLQGLLDAEEAEPLLVSGIRGERAISDRLFTSVASGAFTPKQVRNTDFFSTILHLFRNATTTRTAHLRFCNRAEEIASLPAIEQLAAFRQLDTAIKDLPPGAQTIVPALLRLATAFQNSRARLRCASTAVAAERYRLARGAWPSGLEALAPDFLASVPANPFDGKPLRFRRLDGRIVIDSVAADGHDDGGETESTSPPGTNRDLGFRLWDPPGRHQPAPVP